MADWESVQKNVQVPLGRVSVWVFTPKQREAQLNTPLICIHGGPGGCSEASRHYMAPLAGLRPVIFYDQLGSDQSPAPVTDDLMHLSRFVAEFWAVYTHVLPLFTALPAVLGHSWGACIALTAALEAPEKLAGLILSSPLLSSARWCEDTSDLLANLPLDIQNAIKTHEAAQTYSDPEYQQAIEMFNSRHVCRLNPVPEILKSGFQKTNMDIYMPMWGPSEFTCTGSLQSYNAMNTLSALRVRTLLSCGEYDEARPITIQEAGHRIQDAHTHVFAGCAHVPMAENPQEYIKVVDNFLNTPKDVRA